MELDQGNSELMLNHLEFQDISVQEMIAVMADFGLNDSEIAEQLGLMGALQ